MSKSKRQSTPHYDISDGQLKSLARVLLPIMQKYLLSEQGQKDFAEWQRLQLNKQSNIKVSC